jgi:sugar phosphate isomerase/epimerase
MKAKYFGIYDINDRLDYCTRLEVYRRAGFGQIGLYLDENYMLNGEKYQDIIRYAKLLGMEVLQVHLDYQNSNLICDSQSNEYFDYLDKKLEECERLYIPYAVVHASKGNEPPMINDAQIEKLRKVAMRHRAVTLCVENVRNNHNLDAILAADIPNVKMCFDLGHAHAYADEKALFEKYKSKIACSHLHNNLGSDTHNALSSGEIDYRTFAKELAGLPYCSNCLECFPKRDADKSLESFERFVNALAQDIENSY